MKIKRIRLKNISFKVKIFVIIFAAIFVPTITVSLILYSKAENAITEQISKVVTNSMDFSIGIIDDSLQRVNDLGDLLLTDGDLISIAEMSDPIKDEKKTEYYGRIRDLLSFFILRIKNLNMAPGMDSFYLYLVNQKTIIDSKTTFYEDIKPENIDFLRKSNESSDGNSWFVSIPVDYYTLNNVKTRFDSGGLITCNKVLKNKQGEIIAILAMNISESYIADYYRSVQRGITGESFILDADGAVVSVDDKKLLGTKLDKYTELNQYMDIAETGSGSSLLRMDNRQQLAVFASSAYTRWRYVVMIGASEILGGVYQIQSFFLVIIVITSLLMLGITYLISSIFYNPLEKLIHGMQEIKKRNLNYRITDKREDEYQKVYGGFNDMTEELKNLIGDLTSEKILKKEAEIKLLQAQINPHFLYNTLDSIYSIARIKKVEEIASMVYALSKFFRISLSGGKEQVPLKEALELVTNYLTIQNIRFKGKIAYEVDVSEEFIHYSVPKLILQPIVENSIYHGIEKIKTAGLIKISANNAHGMLNIHVEDNGIGIDAEKLVRLKESIESDLPDEPGNFALRNLNRQIKLKYGSDCGIDIESEQRRGTRTTIRLPEHQPSFENGITSIKPMKSEE